MKAQFVRSDSTARRAPHWNSHSGMGTGQSDLYQRDFSFSIWVTRLIVS
jgi:hypothetical protein